MEEMKTYKFYITLDGYGKDVDDALVNAFDSLGIKHKAMCGDIDYEEIKTTPIDKAKIINHMISSNNNIEEV